MLVTEKNKEEKIHFKKCLFHLDFEQKGCFIQFM